MDKQQIKKKKETDICVIDFFSLSHTHSLTNMSQHHHKYSGTFKYKLRKKENVFVK
jgi:hypothetical protein